MIQTSLNSGNTTFMILCIALVCLMTPGLAFFYGGLVRKKNVLTILMQSFISVGIVTVIWIFGGYGLAFGADHFGIIGSIGNYFGLFDTSSYINQICGNGIPFILFFAYQLMFCIIAVPLMTGAFTARINLKGYIGLLITWVILIYIPVCHWVWGNGFLAKLGFVDFAGGTVIHITAGFGALACVIFFGKRIIGEVENRNHNNIVLVAIGTGLLWFGWFGFNAGGALGNAKLEAIAVLNTFIALAVAMVVWTIIVKVAKGKVPLTEVLTGSIAGLATITPCAGYVTPSASIIIGVIAAIGCYLFIEVKEKMKWDDSLDVWAVHGMGGFMGSILIGVFASKEIGGIAGGTHQLLIQIIGVLIVTVYSFVVTLVILKVLDSIIGIRTTKEEQLTGLDTTLLGQDAYSF